MFGVLIISVSSDRLANSLARKNGGVRKAEYRLPLMAWSSWVIPTGLLMYGWAAFYKLNFMLPIVAASLAAMGLQFVMVRTYPVCVGKGPWDGTLRAPIPYRLPKMLTFT